MNYSVVIPCFNRRHLVGRAIESANEQTISPHEIIVIDDGSTDDSGDVAASYANVRVIRQSNAGASSARNRGIREVTGDWIAFLDSDDIWSVDKIEYQQKALEMYPLADLVFCDTQVVKNSEVLMPSRFALGGLYQQEASATGEFALYDRSLFVKMLTQSRCITSAVLVRRSLPELQFPEHIWGSEDWALWLTLILRYRFVSVDHVLVKMSVTDDNLTGNISKILRNDVLTLKCLLKDPLLTEEEINEVQRALDERKVAALYHTLKSGEVGEARILLKDLPANSLSWNRKLVYWIASRCPSQIVGVIGKLRGA
ncbi:glycosyltransferase family 2 protein [bacterium]|nr:glycosyltransferase family 2 protein [bacterium]